MHAIASSRHNDYSMHQTMLRIRDPARTIAFYTNVLGMTLIKKFDFEEMKFSLYFLGYVNPLEVNSLSEQEKTLFLCKQKGCLEFTHNWGTENDNDFFYHNGNDEPRGFGHIGINVPDVEVACAEFERAGARFVKRPSEGKMKGIAFLKDPDGYYVEILSQKSLTNIENEYCSMKPTT
ncbi:hypothetical protein ACOME3_006639 [Neoechinorhynchus agilis]